MLFYYIFPILAVVTAALATPTVPTKVKRQDPPGQIGPFYLRIIARWRTYNNRYAYVDGNDVVVPVPRSTASAFYYSTATSQLILRGDVEDSLAAGLAVNLTSNVAPLVFSPSSEEEYETEWGFDAQGRLTLAGVQRWRGCSTTTANGYRPGINWQFGEGKTTVPDCQPLELLRELLT
ncbi:hypothetical protein ABW19_dt0202485 [Dactylella cylindrospora]|nr:hypothetical protein ABW19_dt0202485 [Dactylella cylindrospora]